MCMKHFAKKIIKSFFKLINKGIWSYEDKCNYSAPYGHE